MDRIDLFEVSVDEACKVKRVGFYDCFCAYCEAKKVRYDQLIFKEVIWEDRLGGIVEIIRGLGMVKFVITVRQTGSADIIFLLQELGCKLGDVVKVPTVYEIYDVNTQSMGMRYDNGFEINL